MKRIGLDAYLALRRRVHNVVKDHLEMDLMERSHCVAPRTIDGFVEDVIKEAGGILWDMLVESAGEEEVGTREDVTAEATEDLHGFDTEVSLFCRDIGDKLGFLLSLLPTCTKEEQQNLIQILRMICNETTEFCASHGEKEEEGPAEAVVAKEEEPAEAVAAIEKERPAEAVVAKEEEPAEAVAANEKSDAEFEEEAFARYRRGWELSYGDSCSFEDLTLFSSMLFTHCTPGFIPVEAGPANTVQICSIKVAGMEHFSWPVEVYGVVAARDAVDKSRNPLFLRPRDKFQLVHETDPFLHLTGPVRAIVSQEPVDIDIQLVVKGTTAAEDRALMSYAFLYEGDRGERVRTSTIENHCCTLELSTQQIKRSVQATIFGVHFADDKPMTFEHGFKAVCSSLPQRENALEVVLFDSKFRKNRVKNGFFNLSRQVVSVAFRGKLKVRFQAYSQSGDVTAEGEVLVTPKTCNTSEHKLDLGGFKVMFTIAWSLLVEDEEMILMNGLSDPLALLPPMDPSGSFI